jgi:hypothetical protein
MMEWNVRPAAELEGLVSSLRCRYVWWSGLMEYSKCQETSNPLSLGLESKDSRSWDGKTDLEDDFVQLVVDPEEVSYAYVEQQFMGLLIYLGLFHSLYGVE